MKGTGIPPEEDYKQAVFITTLALDGYVITVSVTKEKNQDIELNFV